MDLFYVLLILMVVSRGFGGVAERLGQPGLVGELIAGVALGALVIELPGLFPQLSHISDNEVFVTIADLGMFFLMLFAGVEMQPHKILEHSAGALAVASGGMLVPLGLGLALGWHFLPESKLHTAQYLFLGTALAITAVPATVGILARARSAGDDDRPDNRLCGHLRRYPEPRATRLADRIAFGGFNARPGEILDPFRKSRIVLFRYRVLLTIRLPARRSSDGLFEDRGTGNQCCS